MDISLSFMGGLLASLTSCSLAGIPLLIGYIGIQQEADIRRSILLSFCFILGMIITFSILGTIAVLLGMIMGNVVDRFWRYLVAIFIILLGFYQLELLPLCLSLPGIKAPLKRGYSGAILLGSIYGLFTSPCSTPILASILAFASLQGNLLKGIVMLIFYSLGHGMLFLVLGLSTGFIKTLEKIRPYSIYIQKISGFFILIAGIYLFWSA